VKQEAWSTNIFLKEVRNDALSGLDHRFSQ